MDHKDFLVEPRMIPGSSVTIPGIKIIALDPGKSSMKGRTDNNTFLLPNAAQITQSEAFFGTPKETDALVRNSDGLFVVGERAAALLSDSRSSNIESELYGKNRYASMRFRAILEASLSIALKKNFFGSWTPDRRIVLVVGIAPGERRETGMERELISHLAKSYCFDVRFGNRPFEHYEFEIKPGDVILTDQPMGSLISCVTSNAGKVNPEQEHLLQEPTLVMDVGFRTLDLYYIAGGVLADTPCTFDNFGMMEVFRHTIREIKNKYGNAINLSQLQYAIRSGYIRTGDWHLGQSHNTPVDDLLKKNSEAVCQDALDEILNRYDGLQNCHNLVIAGGTGSIWLPFIESRLKGMDGINIISANRNDPELPNVFSNVRGFYFFAAQSLLEAGIKKRKEK